MKTQHKTLSYFVTGSCIKCEKCDLLVLCFQHENIIHWIVNTEAACVCVFHFHDIWELWLLIKMLKRERERRRVLVWVSFPVHECGRSLPCFYLSVNNVACSIGS